MITANTNSCLATSQSTNPLNFIFYRVGETKDLYITLHKLNIVDMLQPPDSPAKYLFKSRHRARLPASISTTSNLLFSTPSKRRHSKFDLFNLGVSFG